MRRCRFYVSARAMIASFAMGKEADIKSADCTLVSTKQMGEAVIAEIERLAG